MPITQVRPGGGNSGRGLSGLLMDAGAQRLSTKLSRRWKSGSAPQWARAQ